MPDDSVVSGLDVKFGTLDFGIEPSGFDLALDVTSTASTMAPSSSAPLPSSDSQKPTQQQQQQQQQHHHHRTSSSTVASDEVTRENENLRRELQTAETRLRQFEQMQELAHMLQESHRALVQTNDHILSELKELKRRKWCEGDGVS